MCGHTTLSLAKSWRSSLVAYGVVLDDDDNDDDDGDDNEGDGEDNLNIILERGNGVIFFLFLFW